MTNNGTPPQEENPSLVPARENFWYALATLYGEEGQNHEKNRDTWNSVICRNFNDKEIMDIKSRIQIEIVSLDKWDSEHKKDVENRLAVINPYFVDKMYNYTLAEKIDMHSLRISEVFFVRKFVFPNISFEKTHFVNKVDFEWALFIGETNFRGVKFYQNAKFNDAYFQKEDVNFSGSRFNLEANFVQTIFGRNAIFTKTIFNEINLNANTLDTDRCSHDITTDHSADFDHAQFNRNAIFDKSIFYGRTNFANAIFNSYTNFGDAQFHNSAPRFYDSKLKKDTVFATDDESKWPIYKKGNKIDKGDKNAYAHLRQIMYDQHRPDDAHFFYRQEMAWKAYHEKSRMHRWLIMKPYKWFSGYGHSAVRPLGCFAAVLALPALVVWLMQLIEWVAPFRIGWLECIMPKGKTGWDILRVSAANMSPPFGFQRKYVCGEFECESFGWIFVGGLQSILAIALVFLIGLALRNRFRWR